MILEERAGYLAARQRTENDIRELAALLEAMEGLSTESREEIELFSLRNRAFHDRIFRTTGRQRLCRMMLGLRDSVERYVRLGAWMAGSMEQVRDEHRAIFDAFRQGDAERMARLCREHVRSTGERLIRAVRDGRGAEAS
jgi:DNA-binding FadR family transcriptional regulator